MVIHDLKHPTDSAISQISNLEKQITKVKNDLKLQTQDIKLLARKFKSALPHSSDSRSN
jgi:predicted  nucleic acid-binding Zn-ribbon protein